MCTESTSRRFHLAGWLTKSSQGTDGRKDVHEKLGRNCYYSRFLEKSS